MQENVICRLTPPVPAALATIGVHGPDAHRVVGSKIQKTSKLGKSPASPYLSCSALPIQRVVFCVWPLFNGSALEHVVVCALDDQTVEIHCHGGVAVTNAIIDAMQSDGCKIVDWSTWSLKISARETSLLGSIRVPRSQITRQQIPILDESLNTKRQAEQSIRIAAEQALIRTGSQRCAGILLDQYTGSLWRSFCELEELLVKQDTTAAIAHVHQLLQWSELGRHLDRPWSVVLVGPPNVGKSSLINAMTGQQVSIVHHQPGTTRDWIDASTQIDGWPISLTDTAGIRETADSIEREGVRHTAERLSTADLVIIVVDAIVGWTYEHEQALEMCFKYLPHRNILCALNKIDLLPGIDQWNDNSHPVSVIEKNPGFQVVWCSARNDSLALWQAISKALVPNSPPPGTAIPFCDRQIAWLERLKRLPDGFMNTKGLDWEGLVDDGSRAFVTSESSTS